MINILQVIKLIISKILKKNINDISTKLCMKDLIDNELLTAEDILDNDNLRWMVFKVKQKGKNNYRLLVLFLCRRLINNL